MERVSLTLGLSTVDTEGAAFNGAAGRTLFSGLGLFDALGEGGFFSLAAKDLDADKAPGGCNCFSATTTVGAPCGEGTLDADEPLRC